jgi:hypothetical protein
MLRVETKESVFNVNAGQAIITYAGEWIRCSTKSGRRRICCSMITSIFTGKSTEIKSFNQ